MTAAAAMVLVTGMALAGCGTSVSGSGAGAPGSLCAGPAAMTAIRVTHVASLSELDQPKPGGPRVSRLTVRDPAKAARLASAVCALPVMPKGVLHCPADFAGGYQLTFLAGSRRYQVVSVQASGCEMVTGAGRTRWVARTPGFWADFARATGITQPRHVP